MLTPRFSASQDRRFVVIELHVPYANVDETEVHVDGSIFTIYSSPYYLRLNFSGKLIENEEASIKHDIGTGKMVVQIPKVHVGEHFKNLDMLTSLLFSSGCEDSSSNQKCEDAGMPDWFLHSQSETEGENTFCHGGYGFSKQHVGVFHRLGTEMSEIIHVRSPDEKTTKQIGIEKKQAELTAFDNDHYLADLFDDSICRSLIKQSSHSIYGSGELCTEHNDLLLNLKSRTNIKDIDTKACGLTLIDVLYGYCYDQRTTEGEMNVESGWTISTLSSCLSWLEYPLSIKETVIGCIRRSLIYPLYRNWGLSICVLDDVAWLLGRGRKHIVKALLEIHQAFVVSEPRYIFNQLYIDDMCVWVQHLDDEVIHSLQEALSNVELTKSSVGLDLVGLEHAANITAQEETLEPSICMNLENLRLDSDDSESDSNSDKSSYESDTSTSSNDSSSLSECT